MIKVQIAYRSNGLETFSTRLVEEGTACNNTDAATLAAILCCKVQNTHDDKDFNDMCVYFDGIYQNSASYYTQFVSSIRGKY